MAATETVGDSPDTPAAPTSSSAAAPAPGADLVIQFGADDGGRDSLRTAFEEYRRSKQRQAEKAARARKGDLSRTPEQMEALRAKFLERARSYMGVPYAKRFFKEGTPEFEAPLFLDWCEQRGGCGLVRQAMRDLEEDFGFRLGRWNQAYQFDTLMDEERTLETLKPGDLVFYQGDYVSPDARKQRYDMVHVEIWLGGETGEATLGARWRNGKVSEFPSYKFVASAWTNVKILFRGIEPWLRGECRPRSGYAWEAHAMERHKRSIFAAPGAEGDEAVAVMDSEARSSEVRGPSAYSARTWGRWRKDAGSAAGGGGGPAMPCSTEEGGDPDEDEEGESAGEDGEMDAPAEP